MITINNVQFRNLEEQVLKNKDDISYLINEQGVLNQFGIKVIGQVEYLNDLPTPEAYKESNPGWEYGDAYAVGLISPYSLYILTRADNTHTSDYWFNIGQFPAPGPEGKAGEASDITVESTTTTLPGSLARVVNTGDKTHAKLQFYIPAGKKGDQGITPTVNIGTVNAGDYANVTNSGSPTDVILDFVVPRGPKGDSIKGDPGDSFKIIGTLDNTNQLPTPSESIRSNAYLIADNTGRKHLWVITGDTTLLWTDAGAITGIPGQAATISVGGTVTLPANSQASVENAGTSSAAVLNFSIPKGKDGSAATISVGSVSTLPAGSQATVTNIGTSQAAIFNFGIPKGDKGNTGDTAQSITIDSPSSATSGTLTDEQLTTLQASDQNYIIFNNEIFRLEDKQFNSGFLIYSHTGQDNTKTMFIKEISITISTKSWVLTKLAPQSKLTNLDLTNFLLPIGAYYGTDAESLNTVEKMNAHFGGTWEMIKGRSVVGYDPDDTDFNQVGKTGGEKTHTLTINEIPSHNHNVYVTLESGTGYDFRVLNTSQGDYNSKTTSDNVGITGITGLSQPHNNMGPYVVAYLYHRIG